MMYSILIVDDERTIRMMLSDFLEESYTIFCAEDGLQALELLAKEHIDLILSDINMPGMNGIELLHAVHDKYPSIKTALITAYNVDEYIQLAKKELISNIIPKTVPFNFAELDTIIKGLLSGEIFGLGRYLLPGGTILDRYRITSSQDGREAREKIAELFVKKFGTSGDMRLVLDEIITNAIYHAPANPDGADKYAPFSDITLAPDEYVDIECGFDNEKYGVAVVDPKGRLKKATVIEKMERQLTGTGVLDNSGRGIHMSRVFADRLIINIDPDKKTEVILMNYFSPTYRGYKPLYINEL
jgi:CheY-like chemotaxis protein/anti-sigma regulatory factor (Ser/Thr protein kinase)